MPLWIKSNAFTEWEWLIRKGKPCCFANGQTVHKESEEKETLDASSWTSFTWEEEGCPRLPCYNLLANAPQHVKVESNVQNGKDLLEGHPYQWSSMKGHEENRTAQQLFFWTNSFIEIRLKEKLKTNWEHKEQQ